MLGGASARSRPEVSPRPCGVHVGRQPSQAGHGTGSAVATTSLDAAALEVSRPLDSWPREPVDSFAYEILGLRGYLSLVARSPPIRSNIVPAVGAFLCLQVPVRVLCCGHKAVSVIRKSRLRDGRSPPDALLPIPPNSRHRFKDYCLKVARVPPARVTGCGGSDAPADSEEAPRAWRQDDWNITDGVTTTTCLCHWAPRGRDFVLLTPKPWPPAHGLLRRKVGK